MHWGEPKLKFLLSSYRSVIAEKFIWKMLCQLLYALRECHNSRRGGQIILHRDIKPANVFLSAKKNAILGDFGMARSLSASSKFARTYVGTPYYMSPVSTLSNRLNRNKLKI